MYDSRNVNMYRRYVALEFSSVYIKDLFLYGLLS